MKKSIYKTNAPTKLQLTALLAAQQLLELTAALAGVRLAGSQIASVETDLLTPAQAARRLKVSPRTLANWRSAGTGPKFVVAGGIRYRHDDLDAFISGRRYNSTSEYSAATEGLV